MTADGVEEGVPNAQAIPGVCVIITGRVVGHAVAAADGTEPSDVAAGWQSCKVALTSGAVRASSEERRAAVQESSLCHGQEASAMLSSVGSIALCSICCPPGIVLIVTESYRCHMCGWVEARPRLYIIGGHSGGDGEWSDGSFAVCSVVAAMGAL